MRTGSKAGQPILRCCPLSACARNSLRSVWVVLSALALGTGLKTLRNDLRFPALELEKIAVNMRLQGLRCRDHFLSVRGGAADGTE